MRMNSRDVLLIGLIGVLCCAGLANAEYEDQGKVEVDLGASREASRTDDETVAKEEEAIKLDGLSVSQMKELRDKSEKFHFQAEVNRMMTLIINSLYRNKEIFLRELISNASDALDKIRLISLTEKEQLDTKPELTIHIKADKDANAIHITDSGIGMTRQDLVNNLGTIAKSGTSEFFMKLQESKDAQATSDLIGQFGVGFYSSFLVADRVVVTTKHNDDVQYIWESNSSEFSIVDDPRGNTLGRGTTVSIFLKKEAQDYAETDSVKNLVKKYSQFINFPIYVWESKTVEVEEPIEEEDIDVKGGEDKTEDEEGVVEVEKDDAAKTKTVSKTTWDWVLLNNAKPLWTRKPSDIEDSEYEEFYKTLTKESKSPLTKTHFIAEGEVTFKALLFVPESQPTELFNKYGTKTDSIKLYVRRVFITDDFQDMMPNYLSFVRGIVDSDDLPLNISREMLQQHKLLKVIKKKLVRKTLDMLKKLDDEQFEKFWAEYSTNIKLGVIEDSANRNRLAKLLKFSTSNDASKMTSLAAYVERMKEKQDYIFYMAGGSRKEVETSPFVERLLKKGYEVLYLTEAIDEYAVNALPEFEGKKFQNVAKEGLTLDEGAMAKERLEKLKESFEPLTKWLADEALKDQISKAEISERLDESPCALVSSRFGWTANMERIVTSQTHSKTGDAQREYYLSQKKTLEINPRHPLVKELLKRVRSDPADKTASNIATMMFRTATLRSGYMLNDTPEFAKSVEEMMRQTLGVPLDEAVDEEPEEEDLPIEDKMEDDEEKKPFPDSEMHDEL